MYVVVVFNCVLSVDGFLRYAFLGFSVLYSSSTVGFGVNLFFLVVDDGSASLAHHLPADIEGNCILASASATGCRQVEAKTTSRTPKTDNFRSTDKVQNFLFSLLN